MNQGDENGKSIPKRASTKTSIKLNQTSTIPAKNQKVSLRRSSNLNVNISQNSKNFVEFMISICAIIGGVYTIAGIIDSIIYKSVSYVFKSRIGKLS
jgi:hypothetical protein